MFTATASIQVFHLLSKTIIRTTTSTDPSFVLRSKFHAQVAPSSTSNVVLRIERVNIMLLACKKVFHMPNVFEDVKAKRIRTIIVEGALQMRIFMLARFQIAHML